MFKNSNKAQKIIISIYLILSPVFSMWLSYMLSSAQAYSDDEAIGLLIISLIFTIPFSFIIFGIITIILYKLWGNKK